MDYDLREQVIQIVKRYKCIYDPRDVNYKNSNYKTILWEKIGRELHVEGNAAKRIWRSLRDGYMRYKKQMKQQTGSERKNIRYVWSQQLAFLDGSLELRPTSTNIPSTRETTSPGAETSRGSSTSVTLTSPGASRESSASDILTSPSTAGTSRDSSASVILSTPSTPHLSPAQNSVFSTIESLPPSPSYYQEVTSPQQQERAPLEEIALPQPIAPPPQQSSSRRTSTSTGNNTDKILEYIKNKKPRKTLDEIDHLFMSYSSTFKRFPPVKQAQLKIELAKLFSEAEIDQLQNNENVSLLVYSDAYSIISQESDQTTEGNLMELPQDLSNRQPQLQEDTDDD